ncbi:MAG TPA: hypothetical protein VFU13_00065 [Steroidobacteraceae bacterium]|nr:hypothetical protein [Steroidobacteraceae bacterium]
MIPLQHARAHARAFEDLIVSTRPQWAITLTWKPARRSQFRDDLDVERAVRKGMCVLARALGGQGWQDLYPPTIAYIGVLENGVGGDVHVHLAVRVNPGLSAWGRSRFTGWWMRNHGFAHFKKVFGARGLAKYMSKHFGPRSHYILSKDLTSFDDDDFG